MRVTSSSPPSNRGLEKLLKTAEYSGKLALVNRRLKDIGELVIKYNFVNVTEVDLTRNRLSEIPPEIFEWQSVSVLTLPHNLIKTISEYITELKLLEELNLSNNCLAMLPPQMCELHHLTIIRLSSNKLISLPEEVGKLKMCQELDVSMNELVSIPKEIAQMSSLQYLNVRRNKILSLPEEISTMQLTHLDAGCNLITVVPVGFQKMTALRSLVLENNPLSSPSLSVLRKGLVHLFRELEVQAEKAQIKKEVMEESSPSPAMRNNVICSNANLIEIQARVSSVAETQNEADEERVQKAAELSKERRKMSSPAVSMEKTPSAKKRTEKPSPRRQRSADIIPVSQVKLNETIVPKERKRSTSDGKFVRKSSNEALLIHQNLSGFPGYKPHGASEKVETATNGNTPGGNNTRQKPNDPVKSRQISSPTDKSNKKPSSASMAAAKKGFIPSTIKPRASALSRMRGNSFNTGTGNDKESPFTVRRKAEKLYEELEMMENVRQSIETRLKITLGDDLPAALSDGVALCHLANHARQRSITTIHVPSPAVPKLSLAKRRRNVENFLDACVKIGVSQLYVCSAQDILLEKNISKVAGTVNKLLTFCPNLMPSPKRQAEAPTVKITPSTLKQ